MKPCMLASALLALAGILHLVRAFLGWSLIVGGRSVPMWASVVGGIIMLWLSWQVRLHHSH